MTLPRSARRHWRTLLGAAVGALLGGLYAQFIGCRTGTCLITSHVWSAALFFGFTGGVIGWPGRAVAPDDRSPDTQPHR